MQRARFLRALCCTVSPSSAVRLPAPRTRMRLTSRALGNPRDRPRSRRDGARESDAREAMCLMIELAATASNLPLEFFARVIWQESRFRSDAIGPMTRRGQRAQGIAQFMPGTANERGLLDPFNPVQALPKWRSFWPSCATNSAISDGGRRLQCRPAPGSGVARGHRGDAAGDAQLTSSPSRAPPSRIGRRRRRAAGRRSGYRRRTAAIRWRC